MIAKLRKLLADCHMSAGDKTVKSLGESNFNYLVERAKEELLYVIVEDPFTTLGGEECDRRLKLVVQLVTIARNKLSVNRDKPVRKDKTFPEG